ncbi:MAG: PDZ domain-containing protein [Candidatus Nitrosotenuis sp.]|nr:MAG: PDZ domain-containing protein [Candidatus Nitrosotenuis sp.]
MKSRQTIQLTTIGILGVLLLIGVFTNFGRSSESRAEEIKVIERQPETKDVQTSISSDVTGSNEVLSLSSIFKRTENSVVQITSKVSETNSDITVNGNPLEKQSTKLGSGFIYSDSGLIITNNHVIKGSKTVDVTFVDGNTYSANVTGTDPSIDIAVLQIMDDLSEEIIIPLVLGDSSKIEVGDQVVAIGNPFGLSGTMTAGIVSQIGRLLPNQEGFSIPNVIQTDAAINPGNSGGPLLNQWGKVIGINTAIQSNTGEFAGVGFAIPSNAIKKIVPMLIEKGGYSHPWLGIAGTSLTSDIVKKLDLPKNYKGVLVTKVVKDSPAEKAGLREATYNINQEIKSGDVITSVDEHKIKDITELIMYLSENKNVGDKIALEVNRDGSTIKLTTILKERSSN